MFPPPTDYYDENKQKKMMIRRASPSTVCVQIFMVGIWNAFKTKYSSETSWRLSFIVPASIVLMVAIGQLLLADDCPKGNYKELEKHSAMTRKSSAESFKKVGTA